VENFRKLLSFTPDSIKIASEMVKPWEEAAWSGEMQGSRPIQPMATSMGYVE
jgi:hypothetical protein